MLVRIVAFLLISVYFSGIAYCMVVGYKAASAKMNRTEWMLLLMVSMIWPYFIREITTTKDT